MFLRNFLKHRRTEAERNLFELFIVLPFRIVGTEPYGAKFTAFACACDVCHKSQKLQEPFPYSGPGDYMLSCITCDAKLCEKCYKEELHCQARLHSQYDM